MLGMKSRSGDVDRVRSSLMEIQEQLNRCKSMVCECDVDLDKYNPIVEKLQGNAGSEEKKNSLKQEENSKVEQEKQNLLAKEQKLIHLSDKIIEIEEEYQNFIQEKKSELQNPEAELSRIKVEVKRRKAEVEEISFEQELAKLPEFLINAEAILRELRMKEEQDVPEIQVMEETEGISAELIENTKQWIELDEKMLSVVRKAVHTAKEILAFMEFRFPELDRMMAKVSDKELEEEWNRLQQDKKVCERHVNEQLLLAKRAADRLFEVRRALEHPRRQEPQSVVEENAKASVEDDFQKSVDYMKEKMGELRGAMARFMQTKEMWMQEFSAMEMQLEELWRNL